MKNVKEDMVEGYIHETKSCGLLEIVKYVNSYEKVEVRFVGYNHIVHSTADRIRRGAVKNVFLPSVCGIGYIGIGKYSAIKDKKAYSKWHSMIHRCYSPETNAKNSTYKVCSVSEDWHNFQNFAEWFYEISNFEEGMQIDKDILEQGNKEYSAEKCIFVTPEVNMAIAGSRNVNSTYKTGVSIHKVSGKFQAGCKDGKGKRIHIGLYETEDEAHSAYKERKYIILKELASRQTEEAVKQGLLLWKIPDV